MDNNSSSSQDSDTKSTSTAPAPLALERPVQALPDNMTPNLIDPEQLEGMEEAGSNVCMVTDTVSTTATSEQRKTSKPVMEKRRRARINVCLSELKSLLMDVIKAEGTRHSKMEKADILEMTVRHLRQLQRFTTSGGRGRELVTGSKYRHGFNECINEVGRFLNTLDVEDIELKSRILDHLANCSSGSTLLDSESQQPTVLQYTGVSSGSQPRSEQYPGNSGEALSMSIVVTSGDQKITSSQESKKALRTLKEHSQTYQPLLPKCSSASVSSSAVTSTMTLNELTPNRVPVHVLSREGTPMHGIMHMSMASSLPVISASTHQLGAAQNIYLHSPVTSSVPLSMPQHVTPAAMLGGLHLVPTKLPTGELAFILPSNVTNVIPNAPAPSYVIPVYTPGGVLTTASTITSAAHITAPINTMVASTSMLSINTCTAGRVLGTYSPEQTRTYPSEQTRTVPEVTFSRTSPLSVSNAVSVSSVSTQSSSLANPKPHTTSALLPSQSPRTSHTERRQDSRPMQMPPVSEDDVWRPW